MRQSGLPYEPYTMEEYQWSIVHEAQPHIGHRNHLCDMAEKGQISLEQMKALAKDPKFICKKCGRAAHSAVNLCEPVPL